jgi:hypothetical protein
MSTQNEKPIIFSSDMVKAILDGRKTQTRRIIKPQPPIIWDKCKPIKTDAGIISWCFENSKDPDFHGYKNCPYGVVGDRLWVRESFEITGYSESTRRLKGIYLSDKKKFPFCEITKTEWDKWESRKHQFRKTSGRFMYKSLARIWLEITSIRVERVQDISETDARVEGVFWKGGAYKDYGDKSGYCGLGSAKKSFRTLWDSLNAKRGYSWQKNPFVWVIEFRRSK